MSDKNILSLLGVILLIIGLINAPGAAWAQCPGGCRDWTTVGAAGTVDEADTRLVAFDSLGRVTVHPSVVQGTLNLRYNIVAVDGLFGASCAELGVLFRDNGAAAGVVVHLKRANLVTGAITTLLTLNSNDFTARNGFQLRTVHRSLHFDFFDFAYFMDVALLKTTGAGSPALAIIQLASVSC